MKHLNKLRVALCAAAVVVAAAFFACNKEKAEEKRETDKGIINNVSASNHPTLDELLVLASVEDKNHVLPKLARKDYSSICEKALKEDTNFQKSANMPIYFGWHLVLKPEPHRPPCVSDIPGICIAIVFNSPDVATSNAYEFGGKLIIVPDDEDNGFTKDGYLVVGCPIEIEGSAYVIKEGIYSATFDENAGRFVAVAVDFERN